MPAAPIAWTAGRRAPDRAAARRAPSRRFGPSARPACRARPRCAVRPARAWRHRNHGAAQGLRALGGFQAGDEGIRRRQQSCPAHHARRHPKQVPPTGVGHRSVIDLADECADRIHRPASSYERPSSSRPARGKRPSPLSLLDRHLLVKVFPASVASMAYAPARAGPAGTARRVGLQDGRPLASRTTVFTSAANWSRCFSFTANSRINGHFLLACSIAADSSRPIPPLRYSTSPLL